ncbi:hypothetical protein [Lysobacter gummosus]|uniref:hypothetical protein n=1 Tax=Lysobacter gummosus TaxID=262324 RepID=UPI0036390555
MKALGDMAMLLAMLVRSVPRACGRRRVRRMKAGARSVAGRCDKTMVAIGRDARCVHAGCGG